LIGIVRDSQLPLSHRLKSFDRQALISFPSGARFRALDIGKRLIRREATMHAAKRSAAWT
jgi:hypothetical protein